MKLADLDDETREVIVMAHIVRRLPSAANLSRLGRALMTYDRKHAAERAENLRKAIATETEAPF